MREFFGTFAVAVTLGLMLGAALGAISVWTRHSWHLASKHYQHIESRVGYEKCKTEFLK